MREHTTLGASVIAAVTASLCCIGPLAATLLGIGTFGAAARFEGWRPYFLSLSFALLAAAFYFTYRKREVVCADGACKVLKAPRWNKLLLWIASIVVLLLAGFPYYSGALLEASNPRAAPEAHEMPASMKSAAQESKSEVKQETVTIQIEGMTCEGCAVSIRKALKHLEGVKSVDVSFKKKRAIVKYDPAKVTPEQMAAAINQIGYKAVL